MSAIPKEVRLNYEDLLEMPDDGKRYEVIDGRLFVSPSPWPQHQDAVTALVARLRTYADERGLGWVLVAPPGYQARRRGRRAAGHPLFLARTHARKLTALRLNSGVYAVEAEPKGDEVFRPALFSGLEIPLAKVFDR